MPITLEQARAFDALATGGTFEAAAQALQKGHTAVVYAIKTLEADLELALLDRRGYRTRLTPAGEHVLGLARRLLAAERDFDTGCAELRTGWEPRVRLVFDGIFPADPILRVVHHLAQAKAKTRIDVSTAFLGGVEAAFLASNADMMISVLPPTTAGLRMVTLAPIRALLVAHKSHPLCHGGRGARAATFADAVLLTVRGSDPRLGLSTSQLTSTFSVELSDFAAKKAAIMSKLGFGWLPEHLIAKELAAGVLRQVRWAGTSAHEFSPRLYVRSAPKLGRAGQLFVDRLVGG